MNTYTTIQGQTWDMIAKEVYGNELYAGYLMQSNLKYIEYFVFPAGIVLAIPEISEEIDTIEQPEWRW